MFVPTNILFFIMETTLGHVFLQIKLIRRYLGTYDYLDYVANFTLGGYTSIY